MGSASIRTACSTSRRHVELGLNNTDVAIPLLISSKGYGLMWNTAALALFDNRFPLDMKLTSIAGKSINCFYGPEMKPSSRIPRRDRQRCVPAEVGLWLFSIEGPLRYRWTRFAG